jgi:hypothetical protein
MATWTLTSQGTDGSTNLTVDPTDHVWFNSTSDKNGNIVVGSYQDFIHIYTSNDLTHRCSTVHVHNVKPVDSTHYSLDGGGSIALDATHPTTAQCPFKFNFSDPSSVATSAGKFYFYDGTTDATGMTGVLPQAIQQSNTSWPNFASTGVNGSGAALSLADQATATSHDFFIAVGVSPTTTGAKTVGKMKIILTYV